MNYQVYIGPSRIFYFQYQAPFPIRASFESPKRYDRGNTGIQTYI